MKVCFKINCICNSANVIHDSLRTHGPYQMKYLGTTIEVKLEVSFNQNQLFKRSLTTFIFRFFRQISQKQNSPFLSFVQPLSWVNVVSK